MSILFSPLVGIIDLNASLAVFPNSTSLFVLEFLSRLLTYASQCVVFSAFYTFETISSRELPPRLSWWCVAMWFSGLGCLNIGGLFLPMESVLQWIKKTWFFSFFNYSVVMVSFQVPYKWTGKSECFSSLCLSNDSLKFVDCVGYTAKVQISRLFICHQFLCRLSFFLSLPGWKY